MARIGTSKHPAVARVCTEERAREIVEFCNVHNIKVIVGIEPDKPEDISDVVRALSRPKTEVVDAKIGRNDPCPCGSEKKYKRCCGGAAVS
jgi:SWIM/SEC-C metal-binding protein